MKFFALFFVALVLSIQACDKKETGGLGKALPTDVGNHVKEIKESSPPMPAEFAQALSFDSIWNSAKKEAAINITLAEGFHAYAPGDEIGVPVSLQIEEKNGWVQLAPVQIPSGVEKALKIGTSKILEESFMVVANVDGGQGDIHGKLALQICTDSMCDRPRTHDVIIPTSQPE